MSTESDREFAVLRGIGRKPRRNSGVHNYIALCRDHYAKVGLGADYVKTLFR